MIDQFKNHAPGLESPPQGGFDITPSDTADLSQALRGINVSASGTVRVSTVDGARSDADCGCRYYLSDPSHTCLGHGD